MKRHRSYYSPEFKIKAVEMSNAQGNLLHVAQELNINRDTLKRWKKEYALGKIIAGSGKQQNPEQEEIARLKKALYDASMERDILKKALGIFSKSDR